VVIPLKDVGWFPDFTDIRGPKGPVFSTAIVCGVMAAKKTSDLLPFCHQVFLDKCDIDITVLNKSSMDADSKQIDLQIDCYVSTRQVTGVEMEALTGATGAALCVYDMLKALSHDIELRSIVLISKEGGNRPYQRPVS
jgi:cyclic pyranopterin phosphate synthase